jgi:SAM-dependent methyltransferase
MDRLPKDPAQRRDRLERWAAEQAERRERRRLEENEILVRRQVRRWRQSRRWNRLRTNLRFASVVQRVADSVLDRDLDTSARATEPEHEHPDRLLYAASAWHVLPRALRYLGVTDQDVFIEFGCGKGRVLHQAAKSPFRRVVGVEISPELAEIARSNLAASADQHRCANIEIVVSDAADFRVPDDLTIGYLYHPFRDATLDAVLRNIIHSLDRRPRRVRLIYVYPQGAEQILATRRFRLLKHQRSRLLDSSYSQTSIFESVEDGYP